VSPVPGRPNLLQYLFGRQVGKTDATSGREVPEATGKVSRHNLSAIAADTVKEEDHLLSLKRGQHHQQTDIKKSLFLIYL
jgi:hypothetical protein